MLSTPPAITTSIAPDITACAAKCSACCEEPHWRSIVAAVRTAGGRNGGKLAGWHPADLAARVIDEVVARSGAPPGAVDDVILGCVVQIGQQAMNVARNAVLASSLPESVPA